MTDRVAELRELMREGKRLDREDLPEKLLLLEECVRLHPAEYAVKLTCLEREVLRFRNQLEASEKRAQAGQENVKYWATQFNELRSQFDEMQTRAEAAEEEVRNLRSLMREDGWVLEDEEVEVADDSFDRTSIEEIDENE